MFILALLSKSAVAPLPIVLLLLAWWQRGKICRTDVWRALPFFAAAIGLGLVTYHVEQLRSGPASATPAQSGFLGHIPSAGWTIWFYLGKALLPLHLVPIYPLWQVVSGRLPSWVPALVLVIVALICWRYRRDWGKAALLGLGYFIILLGPVLGFLDIGFMAYSLVADHWQYFAIVGPLGLLAAGIASGFRVQGSKFKVQSSSFKVQSSELVGDDVRSPFGESPSPKGPLTSSPTILLSVVLLVGLGWLTFRQSSIYVDSEHLWRATIASNPGCWEAHSMLADLLKDSGRLDEAIVQYETALESKPDFGRNHALLGNLYRRKGEFERAVAHLEKAVALDPRSMAAHCTLGSILLDQGKVDEGIAQLQLGIANAGPGVSSAAGIVTVGAGTAFSPQRPGLPSAAGITSEGQARRLPYAPGRLAEAHFTVGNAFLFQKGDVKNAIDHFHKAIELRPDYADVYNNLATAVARTGSADPIINHYQAVLEAKPESADARFELGSLLFHQRRPGETIVQLRAALDLRPDFARACDTLAWLLATCPDASYRDGKQAIALAQHAETLTGGKNALALRTLATAYAQAGQFPEAITTAERAERLAIDRADLALANQLRRDLALYQKGQPYRDIQYAGNEQ
ncbi:MAG: hypothetical protein C5B50_23315 [Verrucomicrobia bacterium]|nr:MAG: hypothetical protein C5B50_23315 [Verrucomicrobiota bacterium]